MLQTFIPIVLSLIAVLLMAGMSRWLKLGGDIRITDDDHAKGIAFDTLYGFSATDAVVDRAGYSALVKDAANQHALIYKLGAHFVTRLISPPIEGHLDQKFLTIDLGEPDTAPVTLNLGEAAQYWAAGLRHIPRG